MCLKRDQELADGMGVARGIFDSVVFFSVDNDFDMGYSSFSSFFPS
jgi:hypothetical protein